MRPSRAAALLGTVLLAGAAGATYHVGSLLSRAVPRAVGEAPASPAFTEVRFPSRSGSELHGWLARGEPGEGGIVLLHGIRANRLSMLRRAAFLHAAGYSVLVFDFQAHGESAGERITFGYLEALDARAAVRFLRERLDGEPIGAIGSSLGGVACVVGDAPLAVDALVLEGVYVSIRQAIRNRLRLRLGAVGPWLEPLLTWQLERRMGIDPDALRPIDTVATLAAPALFIAGERDRRATADESAALFEAAPEPKALWTVPGAAHVDFHRHAGDAYEATVLAFLRRHLGSGDAPLEAGGVHEPSATPLR